MESNDIITLVIALSALITSAVSAFEAYRQNQNSVRPVLVILEKLTDNNNSKLGYSLFLVNMGHSLAMNITFLSDLEKFKIPMNIEKKVRTEIAVGRRGILASGYEKLILESIQMKIQYTDINNRIYNSLLQKGNHKFGKGKLKWEITNL